MNKISWNTSSYEDRELHDPGVVSQAGMKHFQIANTAYPINHGTTIAPYRVPSENVQEHIAKVWQ
jgi:hypothetical protein